MTLGRLFEYLKDRGIDKNTLIVFTSDNGPGPLTTQIANGTVVNRYHELPDLLNSVGSTKNYKDRKLSQNEGGIRVPYIVRWPKRVPEGQVDSTSTIQGVDWLPTLASISGADLPKNGIYDGIDVSEAFMGHKVERKEPIFWHEQDQSSILVKNLKGYKKGDAAFELYDIDNDPSQVNNLAKDNPIIASELENELNEWLSNITMD